MAGRAAVGDPWRITTEERAKHDGLFFQLSPQAGFVTGEQAKKFFMQSGLPTNMLGQIWSLADINADGKMDKKEFSIALHLISKKIHGVELPRTLPQSMAQEPSASSAMGGGFGGMAPLGGFNTAPMMVAPQMGMQPGQMQMGMMGGGRGFAPGGFGMVGGSTGMTMPISNGGFVSSAPSMGGFGTAPASMQAIPQQQFGSPQKAISVSSSGGEWAVPQNSKLKYTQTFNMHDRTKKGYLTSMEARSILTQSGLVHTVLAQIWSLSDIDSDGKLTCDEFVVAMHLIDVVRSGQVLPSKIPPELIPPSYRKGQKSSHAVGLPPGGIGGIGSATSVASMPAPSHTDQFSDLLGGFNVAGSVSTPQANGENMMVDDATMGILSQVTFEDKRKENFDKGQAELDRRRQLLLDQQKKLEAERLAKEREEAEKRERKRLEIERKKQMELERQMEKQRQIEQHREEERRKALDQREAARHELERQRQMEWERQRRDQLMAEKQREQALVDQSRAEVAKLTLELEALDSKKSDMGNQTEESRSSVTNVTSQIDRMRTSRDMKMTQIDRLQQDVQEWRNKLLLVQQERQQLDIKYQAENNTVDDTYKTVMHSINNKKTNIDKLKEQLKQIEKDTAENLAKIDTQNNEFQNLQEKVDTLKDVNSAFTNDMNSKKTAWHKQTEPSTVAQQNDLFGAFDSSQMPKSSTPTSLKTTTTTTTTKSDDIWSNAFSDVGSVSSQSKDKTPDAWSNALFSNATDLFKDTGGMSSVQWGASSQTSNSSAWPDAFSPTQPGAAGSSECPGPGYRKFRGMFQFEARNIDELSINPGDIIWIKPDQSEAEEGWLGGAFNGNEGWFPSAYAEEIPADSTGGSTYTNINQTQPPEIQTHTDDNKFEADFDAFGNNAQSGNALTASADSSFTAVAHNAPSPTPGQGLVAPDGLHAQALYTWRAKKDNHLTFEKGEVILVKEQQDMWWSGQLNGKTGWFPKSYVKLIGSSANSIPTAPSSQTPVDPSLGAEDPSLYQNADFNAEPCTDGPASTTENSQFTFEKAIAMYAYNSAESGDLTFNVDDLILITKKDDDWWTGAIGDRTGMFPANYVKVIEEAPSIETQPVSQSPLQTPQQQPSQPEANLTNSQSIASTVAATTEATALVPTPISPTDGKPSQSKKEIAQVIAPYQATGPEQLCLQPNQFIQVRKKSPSGWWEGELQARGQKRKVGWFPANYVKLMGASARSTPADNALGPSPQPSDGSRSATPVSFPAPAMAPSLEQVVALYNYAAQHEDELTFAKGSVINVLEKSDPDWWKGELNGSNGVFPVNYVAPLAEAFQGQGPVDAAKPASSELESEEATEQKRQKLIRELISTEETYCADLDIALNAFFKPLKLAGVLTKEELETIFVNIRDIRRCNLKLLNGFKVRKRTCAGGSIHMIGDILCENLTHMGHYVRFCSCQMNAANLIQRKCENDPKFVEVHKKCLSDPQTHGMTLGSYLMKPMQRITKYPMLFEKILKCTPEQHADHGNIQEAHNIALENCNQVNEGVREKENSDKLEWIQAHVSCEGLPEKLTFNSVTNCLGPRKFLHSGSLYKAKSGKELVGFLFNDFLLLTTPQQSLGSVASVFSFDMKTDTQFKIYRTPIFLNEVIVKKPGDNEGDNTLFHVQHTDRVYSLKAISNGEREAWVKKSEAASKHYLETERKKRENAHQAKLMASHDCYGRLLVLILEGVDLIASDSRGKSDPYCEVSMGAQEHKTKVINNTLNPKWNHSMQFTIKDRHEDVLCITVYDRDLFTPNDFLGRTEIRIKDIFQDTRQIKGPIIKRLKLYEVASGEVIVKLDLQLFEKS